MHEELNKKIAEFVGLSFYPNCECIRIKGICWGVSDETYGKNGNWHFVLPDFTDPEWGIAHLFKWVVPKLYAYDLHTVWTDINHVTIQTRAAVYRDNATEYVAIGDTPALALCYAVEKLIDAQVR